MVIAHVQMAQGVYSQAYGIMRIIEVIFPGDNLFFCFITGKISFDELYIALMIIKGSKLKVFGGYYAVMPENYSVDGVCSPALAYVYLGFGLYYGLFIRKSLCGRK